MGKKSRKGISRAGRRAHPKAGLGGQRQQQKELAAASLSSLPIKQPNKSSTATSSSDGGSMDGTTSSCITPVPTTEQTTKLEMTDHQAPTTGAMATPVPEASAESKQQVLQHCLLVQHPQQQHQLSLQNPNRTNQAWHISLGKTSVLDCSKFEIKPVKFRWARHHCRPLTITTMPLHCRTNVSLSYPNRQLQRIRTTSTTTMVHPPTSLVTVDLKNTSGKPCSNDNACKNSENQKTATTTTTKNKLLQQTPMAISRNGHCRSHNKRQALPTQWGARVTWRNQTFCLELKIMVMMMTTTIHRSQVCWTRVLNRPGLIPKQLSTMTRTVPPKAGGKSQPE
mmetsp:Transcript_28975/g.79481  ORF Transcript_28975/g.79481 Transcript_28975/m.79481 type:complete len:338 (+) Transcript_28975:70-1083(+)